MSAWVVDKTHIDLLVGAADHYGRGHGSQRFRWWKTDADGEYLGWYELHPDAERLADNGGYCEHVSPSRLGQILADENVRSVHHRYPDTNPDEGDLPGPNDAYYMGPYVYEDPGYLLTPVEVFSAIDCLDYQSCESDDWRKSNAYAALRSLRETVCRKIERYDDAPWGWTAERIVARQEEVRSYAEDH